MKQSAGILLYRMRKGQPEYLLVHPGGPFWAKKDQGAWSIPKGEFGEGEDPLTAARREWKEETGSEITGLHEPLSPVRQPSGKIIHAFLTEGAFDPSALQSNTFSLEWPPHSGRTQDFPEIDTAAWFDFPEAIIRIQAGQRALLEEAHKKIVSNKT